MKRQGVGIAVVLGLLLAAGIGQSIDLTVPCDADEATARRYALAHLREAKVESLDDLLFQADLPTLKGNRRCAIGGWCIDSNGNRHRFNQVYRTRKLFGWDWWQIEISIYDDRIVDSLLAKENGQWYWEPLDAASR